MRLTEAIHGLVPVLCRATASILGSSIPRPPRSLRDDRRTRECAHRAGRASRDPTTDMSCQVAHTSRRLPREPEFQKASPPMDILGNRPRPAFRPLRLGEPMAYHEKRARELRLLAKRATKESRARVRRERKPGEVNPQLVEPSYYFPPEPVPVPPRPPPPAPAK